MSSQYDAIVIGGGHNGLTTAAYLAKSGKKVLVLEARNVLGGAAVTEEIYPGFKYDCCAMICDWLSDDVVRDLELVKHGLDMLPQTSTTFSPLPDGGYFFLREDEMEEAQKEIAKFSKKDAQKYPEYIDFVERVSDFISPFLNVPALDITDTSFSSTWQMLRTALRFRRLGKEDMYELMRLTSMSISDYLDEWFESDVLKGVLASTLSGCPMIGPKSPGTGLFLLGYHAAVEWSGYPRGGIGAVSASIAKSARSHGAEIRMEAPVARIIVKNGATTGVALESGEEISGKIVAASTDLHRTFLKLLDPGSLDPKFLWHVRNFRLNGASAKVNLALSELPNYTCLPGDAHQRGFTLRYPSVDFWERAYDDAKYGRFPKEPCLYALIPSLMDPGLAPKGKHVMNLFIHYVPYHLKEGNWNDRREELGDLAVDLLTQHAPNFKKSILHRQVLTPLDLENIYGLTNGDNSHGEFTLDQLLFMRPVPGWTHYRMPIKNLYLCGSSAHPGAGISARPGHFAARQILEDWHGVTAA
ncbi:MAG: NAD(P)/FAD-dependent oxidoreductase [Acidobacteriota bacterium]|nr:MAG: NAD(P)/FAD-dependent oxidoreductase [Acidobacteriota bacterium]